MPGAVEGTEIRRKSFSIHFCGNESSSEAFNGSLGVSMVDLVLYLKMCGCMEHSSICPLSRFPPLDSHLDKDFFHSKTAQQGLSILSVLAG